MNTLKLPIVTGWTRLADASDTSLLITWDAPSPVEFAITQDVNPPTGNGHQIELGTVVNRALIGSGYVWARVTAGAQPNPMDVTISTGIAPSGGGGGGGGGTSDTTEVTQVAVKQAVQSLLTNAQLRATAVPVSMVSTLGLTDTQLRAAALPVSAVALPLPSGAATEASIAAISAKTPALGAAVSAASQPVVIASDQGAVPVSNAVSSASANITTQNLVPAGAATAASSVEVALNGAANLAIQVTGVYTGVLNLQVTIDGTNWVTIGGNPMINVSSGGYLASISSALQGIFQADVAGCVKARISALGAVTGSATVSLRATAGGAAMVALDASLPQGTSIIGAVNQANTWTMQVGNTPNTTPILANPGTPTASTLNSLATTNATLVKAAAGTLYSIVASNAGAAAAFLKIYNKATAPTVGTDVPVLVVTLPASGHVFIDLGSLGLRLSAGIAFAITNLVADTDTTAVVAAQVKNCISYL